MGNWMVVCSRRYGFLTEMAQDPRSKKMLVQLLDGNDPSAEVDRTALGRWHEYVESYVLRQPTEWMPEHKEGRSAVFLARCAMSWGCEALV